jgi:hypothetical protein
MLHELFDFNRKLAENLEVTTFHHFHSTTVTCSAVTKTIQLTIHKVHLKELRTVAIYIDTEVVLLICRNLIGIHLKVKLKGCHVLKEIENSVTAKLFRFVNHSLYSFLLLIVTKQFNEKAKFFLKCQFVVFVDAHVLPFATDIIHKKREIVNNNLP